MPNMHEAPAQSLELQRKKKNYVEDYCLDVLAISHKWASCMKQILNNENQSPKVNKANAQFTKKKGIAPSKII